MSNTFGEIFRLTSFGESHGEALGGIIDGCPSGIVLDIDFIQSELARRKPGQSAIVTQRKEDDLVHFYSGVFEGKTTGAPIGFSIFNTNQKSKDYSHIAKQFRPSHADYTYHAKYGHRDYRGGGRTSARETVARIVAGAIAKLAMQNISIQAYVGSVGTIALEKRYTELDLNTTETNPVRCPDPEKAAQMEQLIKEIRKQGDTIGGTVQCVIQGVPVGLGEPVFNKLHAKLGSAMLSINAAKGFEYGSGFEGTTMKGSEHNDAFIKGFKTQSNFSGGIQGGISNGQDIYFKVAFKPVATIMIDQNSLDTDGNPITVSGKGRHDPCVVPRAVPIVEAMAAMTLLDFLLLKQSNHIISQ